MNVLTPMVLLKAIPKERLNGEYFRRIAEIFQKLVDSDELLNTPYQEFYAKLKEVENKLDGRKDDPKYKNAEVRISKVELDQKISKIKKQICYRCNKSECYKK